MQIYHINKALHKKAFFFSGFNIPGY